MAVKISVVIPIYNAEKYLESCIMSILKQDFEDFEVILINDGSTDLSDSICRKYVMNKKIKYYYNSNRGCSYSRNLGIKEAKGEFIIFVDSDDYILDGTLKKAYTIAVNKKLDYLVYGITYLDKKNGEKKDCYPKFNGKKLDYLSSKMLLESPVNKLFKKEILLENKIFFPENSHSGEDLNFCFKYFLKSKTYGFLEECLYVYNLHGENSIYNLDKRLEIFESFDNLYLFLKKESYLENKLVMKKFYFYFIKCCIWIPMYFFKKRKLEKNSKTLMELKFKLFTRIYVKKRHKVLYYLLERILWLI